MSDLSELKDLALDDEGIDNARCAITMCKTCFTSLKYRRIPRLALKNNLEVGRLPPELACLTWAEERLISIYNIHIHMLHFYDEDRPGHKRVLESEHKQPHFRGAAYCVPQDIIGVNKLLPPPPSDLPKIFQVCIIFCVLVSRCLVGGVSWS